MSDQASLCSQCSHSGVELPTARHRAVARKLPADVGSTPLSSAFKHKKETSEVPGRVDGQSPADFYRRCQVLKMRNGQA